MATETVVVVDVSLNFTFTVAGNLLVNGSNGVTIVAPAFDVSGNLVVTDGSKLILEGSTGSVHGTERVEIVERSSVRARGGNESWPT